MSKILVLDLESSPSVVFTWRAYDESSTPEKVIEPGRVLMVGYQWLGETKTKVIAEWHNDHETMIREVHTLICEADVVIGFNHDKFDMPILMGEFALLGLTPPPPITSIDVLKVVRKFGLFMNRLAYVAPLFGVGAKIKHEGFDLWRLVLDGNKKAQKRMEVYCAGDVNITAKLYERIKPYIRNHPHLGDKKHECGCCGSNHIQHRGFTRSKIFKTQRLHCQACGSWSTGKRTKIGD